MEKKQIIPMNDVKEMAQTIAKSGLFPDINTTEKAFTLMMLCQAEGLHPMEALRRYNIISGRPAMKADAMLAEFNRRGGKVEWLQHTDQIVKAKFTHPNGSSIIIEWTIERAAKIMQKGNSLTKKDNWRNYPRQMLRARTISEGVRAVMPEVCVGIYTPEEVSDLVETQPQKQPQPELKPPEPKQPEAEEKEETSPEPQPAEQPERQTDKTAELPQPCIGASDEIVHYKKLSFQQKVVYLRKAFQRMREILGDEVFLSILKSNGYNNLKEIKRLEEGEKVLEDMEGYIKKEDMEGYIKEDENGQVDLQ